MHECHSKHEGGLRTDDEEAVEMSRMWYNLRRKSTMVYLVWGKNQGG